MAEPKPARPAPPPLVIAVDATGVVHTHADNFTVPLVFGAWLLLTAALAAAAIRRRLPYEVFLASHASLALFVLAAELHAYSQWWHTLGALVVYAADKARRAGAAAPRSLCVMSPASRSN